MEEDTRKAWALATLAAFVLALGSAVVAQQAPAKAPAQQTAVPEKKQNGGLVSGGRTCSK
jgi:hypothetical protein